MARKFQWNPPSVTTAVALDSVGAVLEVSALLPPAPPLLFPFPRLRAGFAAGASGCSAPGTTPLLLMPPSLGAASELRLKWPPPELAVPGLPAQHESGPRVRMTDKQKTVSMRGLQTSLCD